MDLKNTSELLKAIENTPRATVAQSDDDEDYISDSNSSSDDDDDDNDSDFDLNEDGEVVKRKNSSEHSYLKLKQREMNRMNVKNSNRMKKLLERNKEYFEKNSQDQSFMQCQTCYVEHSMDYKYRLFRSDHLRQHDAKEFKHCPHCSMSFLFDYDYEKHLEDLA